MTIKINDNEKDTLLTGTGVVNVNNALHHIPCTPFPMDLHSKEEKEKKTIMNNLIHFPIRIIINLNNQFLKTTNMRILKYWKFNIDLRIYS